MDLIGCDPIYFSYLVIVATKVDPFGPICDLLHFTCECSVMSVFCERVQVDIGLIYIIFVLIKWMGY